ncbi:TetR/AcrR family transcriptional regulator [Rhodococcus sp. NCIMB 12038]|uniref:TetR/AcrR family transcriptional regulator n=1 Tax=Rhodococcus sp. NCIMB 12038 TaxID=933800 RepID=UPI000B3C0FAB|nr:TetR/AcrR family transcriptional regulator [Rhodococcus sp. NCIMB 12038]OUS86237.1 TetR family transcriptional regulator [Rhodococcus sp. NCIMB 12038]
MAGRRGWGGSPPGSDEEASRRIVIAAVELISRNGTAISIADVAESLGVIRQTVYRYFPSTDSLLRAAAIAAVDGFLDRLTQHVAGLEDPAEAVVEAVIYTLNEAPRVPQLGIMLSGSHSHTEGITSEEALAFGMTMIRRFDVDWERHGYGEHALRELVEYQLRTMQSFFISPGNPPRSQDELREYLRRWVGSAVAVTGSPVGPAGGAT